VLAQALITKELPATAAYISSFCIVRSHLIMAESATDLRAVKPSSDHLRHESEGGSDQAESARIRARFVKMRCLWAESFQEWNFTGGQRDESQSNSCGYGVTTVSPGKACSGSSVHPAIVRAQARASVGAAR
jgi:hypothetical protein